MTATEVTSYAIRRLNPFLGVIEIVETRNARALSIDGVSWQLQVLAERPEHTWGSLNQRTSVKQFFRFGSWHPNEGMSGVPVNPVLDVGAMLEAAESLTDALPGELGKLPFPLADRHELWLLDRERQPLALLASTTKKRFIEEIEPQAWQATLPAGTPFVSTTLNAKGIAVNAHGSRRFHADLLELQVRTKAADSDESQWFVRDAQRRGTRLLKSDHETLDADAFPVVGVSTRWQDPAQRRLIDDYLDWLAPRLLTLSELPEALRERLELAARAQAGLVDASYRLYPEIRNPEVIDAARVEAKLRSAATSI